MTEQQLTSNELAIIEALARDVAATVALRDRTAFTSRLMGEALDLRSRISPKLDVSSFRDSLVDEVQQRMHDEFVDVSWPRCPRHPHHPMCLRDGAWYCAKDDVRIALLGELGSGKESGG